MHRDKILNALENNRIEWRKHALERMFIRGISRAEVKEVLTFGEIIESYKDDKPFESALFMYVETKPLHVVAGFDDVNDIEYVITAYVPDIKHFNNDFKIRR